MHSSIAIYLFIYLLIYLLINLPRHIRDLNVESARDFKFNQASRWSNNKENDQQMADNAYLSRVYVPYTCVS